MRLALLISSLFISMSAFAGADAIVGKWLTDDGKGHIEVYQKDGKYFGKIVGGQKGESNVDQHNPDEALRSRPLVGLDVLTNLEFDADDNEWVSGKIYDPKKGKTYKAKAWMEDGNMHVRGSLAFFGKTVVWTPLTE